MFSKRALVATAAMFFLAGLCGRSHASGTMSAGASCGDGNTISFSWYFYEWGNITGHPEWVGYDVLRRPLDACGEFERVNAEPFPRVVGVSHGHTYTEPAPALGKSFEYRVILIDANRQRVFLDIFSCECVASVGWASCPNYSAPLTQGTLEDWGWALYVQACPGSCYENFYFSGAMEDELRPYAGTGSAFRFYGNGGCGTTEGCAMSVDHYEAASCNSVTALQRRSWGQLKLHYR